MGLESATYIHQLNSSNPPSTDQLQQADDHLRLIKAALKATFPNITGIVSSSQAQLNGSLVPIGLIADWFGASDTVPSGWAICNGQTVSRSDGAGNITTPDLRDRVTIGAGTIAAQGVAVGATSATSGASGAHTHTVGDTGSNHAHTVNVSGTALDASQLPSHSHYIAANGFGSGGVSSGLPVASGRSLGGDSDYILMSGSGSANVGLSSSTGSGATHSHAASTATDGAHTHSLDTSATHTHSVSTVQPSYGLHKIMKV